MRESRILVVDDEEHYRNALERILAPVHDIETESDAEEAWKRIEDREPDVILLDWNMPKMNGLEFLKQFRAKNKQTPVIMVTTEAEKPRVVEAIRAGVNDYVVKPFTPDSLLKHVSAAIEKVKAAA